MLSLQRKRLNFSSINKYLMSFNFTSLITLIAKEITSFALTKCISKYLFIQYYLEKKTCFRGNNSYLVKMKFSIKHDSTYESSIFFHVRYIVSLYNSANSYTKFSEPKDSFKSKSRRHKIIGTLNDVCAFHFWSYKWL